MSKIYVTRPSMPSLEEYVEEIRPVFESHMLTNMGPLHAQFEQALKAYLGVDRLTLFCNGHMALELGLQALGLSGEVITTPFTFPSTAHAISRCGLTPVFCDVRPGDFTLDPAGIEALITERTSAILPVHVFGNLCDVDAIGDIARRHGLKVIYDAAHTFGVRRRGRSAASFGDVSMLSFHATKVFNCVEGGALAFRDPALASRLYEIKNFGIDRPDSVASIGANAKLDELRAAMGLCNLRRVDADIRARRAVFERYRERLEGVKGLRLVGPARDIEPNYGYCPLFIDAGAFGHSRDEAWAALRARDIYARKYFFPALNDCPCYAGGNATPVARRASLGMLTLPIYPELSPEDVDRICDVLTSLS